MSVLQKIGADTVKQGTVRSWTFFQGETQTLVIKGERVAVKQLYDSYITVAGFNPQYDNITYDPGKGLATLTIQFVNDGQPLYELQANEIMIPVEANEYFAELTEAEVIEVKAAIANHLDSSFSGKQDELYKLMNRGMTEYPESQYVLRETKIVSKRSTVTASFDNVNRVDNPPDTSAVNTLIGQLPTGEWIKKSPIVRQIGSRKWEIVTEWWWFKKASRVIYGGTWL